VPNCGSHLRLALRLLRLVPPILTASVTACNAVIGNNDVQLWDASTALTASAGSSSGAGASGSGGSRGSIAAAGNAGAAGSVAPANSGSGASSGDVDSSSGVVQAAQPMDASTGEPSGSQSSGNGIGNSGAVGASGASSGNDAGASGAVGASGASSGNGAGASGASSETCPTGTLLCSGNCVDEQTDAHNCGGCGSGYACLGGKTCQSGTCTCPAGQLQCGSSCELLSPQNSCGTSCTQACPLPLANGTANCNAAGCQIICNSTYTLCSGQCVNEQSDGNNCNACGHSCQTGGCVSGACQPVVLVTGRSSPSSIAVNSLGIYWIENSTLFVVALGGGTPVGIPANDAPVSQSHAGCLAADADNVYWSNYNGNMSIMGMPILEVTPNLMTGTATVLAQPMSLSNMQGITLGAGFLYYADNGQQAVGRVPVSGSGGTSSYRLTSTSPFNVAVDSQYVYYGGIGAQGIYKMPLAGGMETLVSDGPGDGQSGIAVDSNNVYWADNSGSLRRAPIAGGTSIEIDSGPVGDTIGLDSSYLYWVSSGSLVRAYVATGTPGPVTTLASTGGPMTFDATAIYWATSTDVMRLAK
jgi:hypothetical protein